MKKMLLTFLSVLALLPLSAMAKRHQAPPSEGQITTKVYRVTDGRERLISDNTITSLLGQETPFRQARESVYSTKCVPADPESGLEHEPEFAMQELGIQYTLQVSSGQAKIGLVHAKRREHGPCLGHLAWSQERTMQTVMFKANHTTTTYFDVDDQSYRIEILYRPIYE